MTLFPAGPAGLSLFLIQIIEVHNLNQSFQSIS